MNSEKQIVLITGGNSGLGFSLATLLLNDQSKHVIITSRSIEKGQSALKELKAMNLSGSVEMLQLEVTSPSSIEELAQQVEKKYGRLDVLVNNAGQAVASPGTSLFDHMQQCFAANVSGPAVMIETFLPLLQKSNSTPRIINVGSGVGSIGITLDPNTKGGPLATPYKASKSALNMLSSVKFAQFRLDQSNVKIFTYCPGFCVSNLSQMNKSENGAKPIEEGARPMISIINGERDAESGHYVNSEGGHHPW